MIDLVDTNSAAIAAEFVRARRRAGSPAMSMVMTLVVVVDDEDAKAALAAARAASREHPARVLGLIIGDGRGKPHVNAEIEVGATGWTGETALIRLSGAVTKHPESVVLPLLLPDSPVVVWWASAAPENPAEDPLGKLAKRRITDAAAVSRGKTTAMLTQCDSYSQGNTDLAWTRLTPWRALLAAALDQYPVRIIGGSVSAERVNPSAELLVAWLDERLKVDIERHVSEGPGITRVDLQTKRGPISITRGDGRLGMLSSPGQPDRPVALKRRTLPELLAEELRHLDEDDIYAAAARRLVSLEAAT